MQLRRWATAAVSVLAVLAVPATAQASVGIGIQPGPVRLAGVAHPGGRYALPAVYVVNTGTIAESVSILIERVSAGAGRTVPPSWVHTNGAAVTLAQDESARIALELVVPATAQPGPYFSDVIVTGGAPDPAGGASFDVGAATNLEFRVVPGVVAGPWLPVPVWLLLTLAALLLLAVAVVLARRSGLRIRIERTPRSAGSLMRRSNGRRRAKAALLAVLVVVAGCGIGAAAPRRDGSRASITLRFNTVFNGRGINVTPHAGTFSNCLGGSAASNTQSKGSMLGYPNGSCTFSPIKIDNLGIPADIKVAGSSATPAGHIRGRWVLCKISGHSAGACTGSNGRMPGVNQFLLENYNQKNQKNGAAITGTFACDHIFVPGGCTAKGGEVSQEGVELIGATRTTYPWRVWFVRITWIVVPS